MATLVAGCQTRIDWPVDREPPTLTEKDIAALPETLTVGDLVRRFGPGMPDPNAHLVMYYQRSRGGQYACTWCPTKEVPGECPPEFERPEFVRDERQMLKWRILAIFEIHPETRSDDWVYVYPPQLKGAKCSGWQDGPSWEDQN